MADDMSTETAEARKARLAAEIRERALELLKGDSEVEGHSLDAETEVFQETGDASVVCAGYYSDN